MRMVWVFDYTTKPGEGFERRVPSIVARLWTRYTRRPLDWAPMREGF